jgi:hypothetical protein
MGIHHARAEGTGFHNTCIFKRRIEAPSYLEFDHLKEMHYYKAVFTLTEAEVSTHLEWIDAIQFTADELDADPPIHHCGGERREP